MDISLNQKMSQETYNSELPSIYDADELQFNDYYHINQANITLSPWNNTPPLISQLSTSHLRMANPTEQEVMDSLNEHFINDDTNNPAFINSHENNTDSVDPRFLMNLRSENESVVDTILQAHLNQMGISRINREINQASLNASEMLIQELDTFHDSNYLDDFQDEFESYDPDYNDNHNHRLTIDECPSYDADYEAQIDLFLDDTEPQIPPEEYSEDSEESMRLYNQHMGRLAEIESRIEQSEEEATSLYHRHLDRMAEIDAQIDYLHSMEINQINYQRMNDLESQITLRNMERMIAAQSTFNETEGQVLNEQESNNLFDPNEIEITEINELEEDLEEVVRQSGRRFL
jgi:hypothetical protein